MNTSVHEGSCKCDHTFLGFLKVHQGICFGMGWPCNFGTDFLIQGVPEERGPTFKQKLIQNGKRQKNENVIIGCRLLLKDPFLG